MCNGGQLGPSIAVPRTIEAEFRQSCGCLTLLCMVPAGLVTGGGGGGNEESYTPNVYSNMFSKHDEVSSCLK